MAADQVPFPSPDDLHDEHADEWRTLLRASYDAQPLHAPEHVARVAGAVLAQARREGAGTAVAAVTPARVVRPQWWWGAAAAAVLMVVVMRPWRPEASQRDADSAFARSGQAPSSSVPASSVPASSVPASSVPAGVVRDDSQGTVTFEFSVPGSARAVSLVGDFNGWDAGATPMVRRAADGSWSASIPLEPGRHEYAFVVDGQRWVVDPLAPQVPDAGFGPTNAVVVDGDARP